MLIRRPVQGTGSLFSSEDFKAGELFTHAQSCIWLLGYSDLADALLQDIDPHSALAATVLGVTYEEFIKRKKERRFKDGRQAAKPFTFGKPGGIGDSKLVLQQRKQGPDTPCPNGPSMIDDGNGGEIPGYKGLRFCVLMDGAERCGEHPDGRSNRVTTWGRSERRFSPTCSHCLDCAQRLGAIWKKQWRENEPYFDLISNIVKSGMVIDEKSLDRWPHLNEWFKPWQRLEPATIMQHVSGRLRRASSGDEDSPFCTLSNGFFQALLADISKAAHRRVTRECYDATIRVPEYAHENSRRSAYAGIQSPLFRSRPIGFFHDELFVEHPESVAHDAATRVSEIMVEEMMFFCPDVAAACAADPTLMRRWLKAAERTVDDNGRLIPWEPK